MGHERWFRGQHDGQSRSFDWLTPARQQGIPAQVAQALYEQATQQAHGSTQDRVQELYVALLAGAHRQPSRPAPGKVTRTMRLQAQRAGKRRPLSNISPLTGQPIAPGKVSLTSYVEPAHGPGHESAHGRRGGLHVGEAITRLADAAPRAAAQAVPIAARTEHRSRGARNRPQAPQAPRMVPEGPGELLPASVRAAFEAAMGRPFPDVRIHTGADAAQAAAAIQANAFTVESDIYFGAGQYAPGTPHGDRVLAHELVHVGQRQDGRMPDGGGVSAPDDPLEREAYGAERDIAQRAQETRAGAAERLDANRTDAGAPAQAITRPHGNVTPANSGHASEHSHAASAGAHPVHRDSAAGGAKGTGPTVPEQSDGEIFAQADAVVDEEIAVEAPSPDGEVGEAGESAAAAPGPSPEGAGSAESGGSGWSRAGGGDAHGPGPGPGRASGAAIGTDGAQRTAGRARGPGRRRRGTDRQRRGCRGLAPCPGGIDGGWRRRCHHLACGRALGPGPGIDRRRPAHHRRRVRRPGPGNP
jgi:hypothetical protein